MRDGYANVKPTAFPWERDHGVEGVVAKGEPSFTTSILPLVIRQVRTDALTRHGGEFLRMRDEL